MAPRGCGGRRCRSSPKTSPSPEYSGTSPAIRRSSVVLPAPFGPGEQHDLARVDVEVDAGEGREASEEAHGGAESDDERHASLRGPGWGATSADECTDPLRRRSNRPRSRPISGTHLFWSLRCPHNVSAPTYAPCDATDHRRGRTRPRDHRDPDPAVRRLPAVGNRPLRGPGAGPAAVRVRPAARPREGRGPPQRHGARPPPRCRRRRRPPPGRPSASSGSRRSASTGPSSRGSASPTSARAPATTPRRPLPGQLGNAAIAGHRTTYGAPFNRLDELVAGDPIVVTTLAGTFRYTVARVAGGDAQGSLRPGPDAERDAHAHDVQPEVLRGATARGEGDARQGQRSPKPVKATPHRRS